MRLGRARPRHGPRRPWLIPALLYALLTVGMSWPLAARFTTDLAGGAHKDGLEDAYQNVWNLWWMLQALLRPTNPLITDRLFYPEHPTLYYHTLSPINALLAAPVTALWGPIAGFNAVALASFFLGALGACWLARDRCGSAAAALLAGIIYAWSPFHMAALVEDGQLQIVALHWLPFYVLFLLRAAERGGRRNVLLAGLFLTLTAWTDWYYTLFLLLFSAAYALWRLAARTPGWPARRALIGRLAAIGALGALGAAPLLAPMLAEATRADYMYRFPAGDAERLSADLLAYWLPARLHALWGAAPWDWGVPVEVNRRLYLGAVALALALLGAWRQPAARRWGLAALGFGVLAFGPTLRVAGGSTGVPLVRVSREPDRFDVIVTLALAVAAAYGARDLLARLRPRPALAATAILAALLALDYLAAPLLTRQPPVPAFLAALPHDDDGALIEYPFHEDVPYRDAERMLFQTIHGRPISGGYHARLYPQPQLGLPVLRDLAAGRLESDIAAEPGGWRAALRTLGYRYIIGYKQQPLGPLNLAPEQAAAFRALVQAGLGVAAPDYEDSWLIVYRVPEAQAAPQVQIRAGWGTVEQAAGGGRYRWMGQRAGLGLYAPAPGRYRLSWSAAPAGGPRTLALTVGGRRVTLPIGAGERRYQITLALPAGATLLDLEAVEPPTSGDALEHNGDTRPISVRIGAIVLEGEGP